MGEAITARPTLVPPRGSFRELPEHLVEEILIDEAFLAEGALDFEAHLGRRERMLHIPCLRVAPAL